MLRRSKRAAKADEDAEVQNTAEPATENTTDNPKQERPRICLIDVDSQLADALKARGLNCYQGTLGPVVEIPNTSQHSSHQCLPNLDFPPNMHEYDIVVIDLQNPKTTAYVPDDHTRTKTKGQEQFYFISSFPETLFDPRPLSASVLNSRLRPLSEKESILIVFTAPQEDVVYQPFSITVDGPRRHDRSSYSLYDFYSDLPGWENITGKDTTVVAPEGATITALLDKHNDDTVYTIAFDHPTYWQGDERVKSKNFIPLMMAGAERVVSFAHVRDKNWAFFFPRIKDKQGFLCDLLERVLPGILPPVFPFSTQFAWLDDPRYRLPNEDDLLSQRARLEAEHRKKLDALDVQIDANREEHAFLHRLLTESGAALVKTVERMLRWLDFDEVVNADETNPEIQEEDLRVESTSGLLVIEVKGIGGTSTDSECSQISKIKYRRSKERNSFDVFGLYCVNHQRFLPPHDRQNPPFNPTQIQDAQNDERGLVTTYDLFKLYFNISRGFVSKEDARKALLGVGLVSFTPSNAKEIPQPFEIHHDGFVVIFQADGMVLQTGQKVILEESGWYSSGTIEEIQLDGATVATASAGEVGIRLSAPVAKGSRLWIREEAQEKPHPTTASTTTNEPAAGGSI
jgi:hypothetical protein